MTLSICISFLVELLCMYPLCILYYAADSFFSGVLFFTCSYCIAWYLELVEIPPISQILLNSNSVLLCAHSPFQMLSVMCIESGCSLCRYPIGDLGEYPKAHHSCLAVNHWETLSCWSFVLWKSAEKLYINWTCRQSPCSLVPRRAFFLLLEEDWRGLSLINPHYLFLNTAKPSGCLQRQLASSTVSMFPVNWSWEGSGNYWSVGIFVVPRKTASFLLNGNSRAQSTTSLMWS